MALLEGIKLNKNEKQELENLLLESPITEVKYLQNRLYIFMLNSKVIVLKNSDLETYSVIRKIQERNYGGLDKNFRKKPKEILANYWTTEEEEYLKYNFNNKSFEEMGRDLNKSSYQISVKAIELKLLIKRGWTESELEYLKKNIKLSNYELSKKLNRSLNSIKSKKRVLLYEVIN